MGLQLARNKKKNLLLTFFYRLDKLIPLSNTRKLKFYLDLEWIFNRLVMEKSFLYYNPDNHPFRVDSSSFLTPLIKDDYLILDLGCNTGDITSSLAKKTKAKVIGIDYNGKLIEEAKAKYNLPNLEFINSEALAYLKGNNAEFDVLIMSHILEHIDEPKAFINQFKSFFKFVYIELPDFDATYHNHYRRDLDNSLVYTDIDHVSEFDRAELNNILHSCGIEILVAEYRFGVQKLWCKVLK